MDRSAVLQCLRKLSHELREVDVGATVPRVHISGLDALTFATEYVARNRPCIILGALDSWPAAQKWDEQHLVSRAGDVQVTVDVTPDGRGDAVSSHPDAGTSAAPGSHDSRGSVQEGVQCFVTPDERRMTLREFFALLRTSRRSQDNKGATEVPYIQHQNDSLASEFSMLEADLEPGLAWANEVFGGAPEASNLWIGDDRSVTSFHKDHYENMYAVLAGTKVFTLLPPSEVWRMYLRKYSVARWVQQPHSAEPGADPGPSTHAEEGDNPSLLDQSSASGPGPGPGPSRTAVHQAAAEAAAEAEAAQSPVPAMRAVLNDPRQEVPWCSIVPRPEDEGAAAQEFPLFFDKTLPEPLVAEVGPAELLYLPSMWWHYVEQRTTSPGKDYVIAVNFWYDMKFDAKFAYFKLVESLATSLGLAPDMEEEEADT